MAESDDPLAPMIDRLKEPVTLAPDLTARIMAEIETIPVAAAGETRSPNARSWRSRRWTIAISPAGGLLAAAALALVVAGSHWIGRRSVAVPVPPSLAAAPGARPTQFILVAPKAAAVTVVGDFNDWSVSATPLARTDSAGVWWVTIPLVPGRYRYAFVVDGTVWRPDPEAPGVDDEFGRPSSVLTIGGA